MNRIKDQRYAEVITDALTYLPGRLPDVLGRTDFLCGYDPLFVGLHRFDVATDRRSYRETAHCVYPWHQIGHRSQQATTVVLPILEDDRRMRQVVVHELGHVLDEYTDFEMEALPVTKYARVDRWEAFAEAFTSWILPDDHGYSRARGWLQDDPETIRLFERIAYGE